MYVVRMIEVAKSLCDALRGVLIELDATGIFSDETWKQITSPDPVALPSPLRRLHRKRRKEHSRIIRHMRELGIADGAELRRIMWQRLTDRAIRLKEIALNVWDG